MPNVEQIQATHWVNARRSQRALLSVSIFVRAPFGDEDHHPSCEEKSHTLVLSAHGALIELRMRVQVDQTLLLQNRVSGIEVRCHVVHVGERRSDKSEVGIEFAEPAPSFWNIEFPPADVKPLN